jgi:predicted Zn-dependent protease
MNHHVMLQRAAALLQNGRANEGATICRKLLAAAPGHPEALHLLAMATRSADPTAAEALFRQSLSRQPRQPATLVNFANFLSSRGRRHDAEELLRAAVMQAPDFAPAWYGLGLCLYESGALDEATRCAVRATKLAPTYAPGWELLAAIEQRRGDLPAAIAACRAGLAQLPDAARLHYSLGQLLRQDCSFVDAARAYQAARHHGLETPDLYRNLGEVKLEAGDCRQALTVLSAGIDRFPTNALLHKLQARLHWEAALPGDPLAALTVAVERHPREPMLWQALADLLVRLERFDEARAALDASKRQGCPDVPELGLLDAVVTGRLGDTDTATRQYAALHAANPGHVDIALGFAEHLLSVRDPAQAEVLCASVLGPRPLDQFAWALRGTAWQLLGDAREAWLLDYQQMVRPVQITPPDGYADTAAFFAAVAEALESLHRTQAHPIDQTLRGGTQTNGFLFRLKHPVLRLLERQIRDAVARALAALPADAQHPFWGRNLTGSPAFRFAGAWSVRLTSRGFHTNHIHPAGWISSALYVALPGDMGDADAHAGSIQFGVPPAELGLALAPRRVITPRVGELILFPSYMWHGTVPFTSAQPRMTVAFDLVPQG